MKTVGTELQALQELLELTFPGSYADFLATGLPGNALLPLPLFGSAVSLDEESVWGATEFVRAARPDLAPHYLVMLLLEGWAICLDLTPGGHPDPPVVRVDLESATPPRRLCATFPEFLIQAPAAPEWFFTSLPGSVHPEDDYWFQRGLENLGRHIANLSFSYDHKDGGQLPRSHVWRPYRFCIQDVIFGITVIRHDRSRNRLDVDLFLTAFIPEYPAESGCRALCLILLSDAYNSGGSLEIKFSKQVEGGRLPRELVQLARSLNVSLDHAAQGGITPREAKRFYLALSGFSDPTRDKILQLEDEGRLSSASVCFGLHHGVWTIPELEVILFGSRAPDTILRGVYAPEQWHLFSYDLFQGRNALMGGYLDLYLARREFSEASGAIVELEDSGPDLEILFDAGEFCKIYRMRELEGELLVPWLRGSDEPLLLSGAHGLRVLLRARELEDLKQMIASDLEDALRVKQLCGDSGDAVCVMVPADFSRVEAEEQQQILESFRKERIGLILCPDFLAQLDQEVRRRFEAIKVLRQ